MRIKDRHRLLGSICVLKGTWPERAVTGLLCTSLMVGSAFAEPTSTNNDQLIKPAVKASLKHIAAKRPTKKLVGTPPHTGPIYKDAPVVAAPEIKPCSVESAAALNKKFNLKGWEINPPSYVDSLTQDKLCWRTNLAKYGFSFTGYQIGIFETNLLNHFVPGTVTPYSLTGKNTGPVYVGQRPYLDQHENGYLFYDLSRYGVPDGQLQLGFFANQSTWIAAVPNSFGFSQIAYYQTFFNKALEFNIGYLGLNNQFMGIQVGGNVANVLGPSGNLYANMGGSNEGEPTPTAVLRWNITNDFYDKGAVQRSIASTAVGITGLSIFQTDHYSNPINIKFTNKPVVFGQVGNTERPLFIDEIGYKHEAGPSDPFTWVRLTGIYNTTLYKNLSNPTSYAAQTTNAGVFFNADRQLWQSEPDSPATAYKGIYAGATANYVSKAVNADYEEVGARVYAFGFFDRPRDSINFTWDHQVFNPYTVDPANASSNCTVLHALCDHHATNTYTLYYNAQIIPGFHILLGAAYVDHTSSMYSPIALAAGLAGFSGSIPGIGTAANPFLNSFSAGPAMSLLVATFINF